MPAAQAAATLRMFPYPPDKPAPRASTSERAAVAGSGGEKR
jgi:hypothetical protein